MNSNNLSKTCSEYRDKEGIYWLLNGEYQLITSFVTSGITAAVYHYDLIRQRDRKVVLSGENSSASSTLKDISEWPVVLPWSGIQVLLENICVDLNPLDDTIGYRYTEDEVDFLVSEDCTRLQDLAHHLDCVCNLTDWEIEP